MDPGVPQPLFTQPVVLLTYMGQQRAAMERPETQDVRTVFTCTRTNYITC